MDWRDRKYYAVRFSPDSYDMRIRILKNIKGVKLHSSTNHKINTKFPDEKELRGYYHVLIGCKTDIKDIVEFELRKAERNDWCSSWKEVQRDISKKYAERNDWCSSWKEVQRDISKKYLDISIVAHS